MASITDSRSDNVTTTPAVDEAVRPHRPPPIATTGPVAWMRDNLFSSTLDTVLTFVAVGIIISTVVGIVQWTVTQANWYLIIFNLRQFMVGRYEVAAEWRVQVLVLAVAFLTGLTLAAWSRVSRALGLAIVVVIAALFVIPVVIAATLPLPQSYLSAGEPVIVSRATEQEPQDQLGFIARGGEVISVELATELSSDDAALTDLRSFSDIGANLLRAEAQNRLDAVARQSELETMLAGDETVPVFTENQRVQLTEELDGLEIASSTTETYNLNAAAVAVQIIDGSSGDIIDETTLEPGSPAFTLTLPDDGWYVIDKRVQNDQSVALLRVENIFPLIERNLSRTEIVDEETGEVLQAGGNFSQFVRVTDSLTIEEPRPVIDGEEPPIINFTDNLFRNTTTLPMYLRLYLAPFLNDINVAILLVVIAGTLGYFSRPLIDRTAPISERKVRNQRARSQQLSSSLLAVVPIFMFVIIYGFPDYEPQSVAVVAFRFAWLVYLYFAAVNLSDSNRGIGIGALALGLVPVGIWLYELFPVIRAELVGEMTGFGTVQAVLSVLWGWLLWLGLGAIAVNLGYSRRSTLKRSQAIIAVVVSAFVTVGVYVLMLAIYDDIAAFIPESDTRLWGGLLLTMMLTVVGIVGAFPLGIMLALGRRSNLPVVSAACTVYIEFVRGVPLITVLFMAVLLVPLVNPTLADVDNVFRAMIGIVLFSAAYLAENVRGGLQSIPPGQEEAARAVGMNGVQITLLITLPQALRAMIPALVGQFIALFKDTSLVTIVGLFDLTGISEAVVTQTEFLGTRREAFLFIIVIYFVISYVMAVVSRRLEATGAGAARRA